MNMSTLAGTGWTVSDLTLGTMMLAERADQAESIRIIHDSLTAGINLIDTADVYSNGQVEEIVGRALVGKRDSVFIATKFGLKGGSHNEQIGASRSWIAQAVESSLRRLKTDYIDLYQVHRFDYSVRIDETLSALTDLVDKGKIRAFGSSSFPAERLVEAQWVARAASTGRFLTEQPRYSIFTRRLEGAVLPVAREYDIGVLAYSPLNGGWLSGAADPLGTYRGTNRSGRRSISPEVLRSKMAALALLKELAAELNLTLPHLALGFVSAHPAIASTIIGPRTLHHLSGLLAWNHGALSSDALDRIDEIVPPGQDLDPSDNYNDLPAGLTDKVLRRRADATP